VKRASLVRPARLLVALLALLALLAARVRLALAATLL